MGRAMLIIFALLFVFPFDAMASPWNAYLGQLPRGSYQVGYDIRSRQGLYVCQTNLWGSLQIGTTTKRHHGRCHLPYADKVYTVDKYSILSYVNGVWQPYYGYYPTRPVVVGYGVKRVPLALCRGYYHGSLIPGKTWKDHKYCDVAYKGKALRLARYSILVQQQNTLTRKIN